jgi:hypothetical protein
MSKATAAFDFLILTFDLPGEKDFRPNCVLYTYSPYLPSRLLKTIAYGSVCSIIG